MFDEDTYKELNLLTARSLDDKLHNREIARGELDSLILKLSSGLIAGLSESAIFEPEVFKSAKQKMIECAAVLEETSIAIDSSNVPSM